MKPRQSLQLRQGQRLSLTTGLRQSIALLRFNATELTRHLEDVAAENPYLLLEAVVPPPHEWQPRWASAFRSLGQGLDPAERAAAPGPSLISHVMAQIDTMFSTGRDRRAAVAFAEALEPSGWLGRGVGDIATEVGVGVSEAEAVLGRLQQIEPAGLFARSLAECLRLQAEDAGRLDAVMSCILKNLGLLAAGDFVALARMCRVEPEDITARLRVIRGFDPKPGAQFEPGAVAGEPDLLVRRGPVSWLVEINRSALPAVSVRSGGTQGDPARAAAREALRLVEQRNATLLRVGQEVLRRQEAVLDHGMAQLKPLTMASVAEVLGLHESTVSRVVAGTLVAAPHATWTLRAFFGAALGDVAAGAVRVAITRLIGSEDAARPLSDAALVAALADEGIPVARRTVAKYREALGIATSAVRRRRGKR